MRRYSVDLFNNGQRKSVSIEADTQEEAVSLAKANNPGWIKDPSRYAGTFLLRGAKDSSSRRSRLHAALDCVMDRAAVKDWRDEDDDEKFIIMASVSGGITGSRSAPLKEDGKIQYFDSQDAANKKATKLNREMNGPNSRASFRYTVQPA